MTQDTNSSGDHIKNRPAPTLWAQRNNVVFITFQVESCMNPQVSFETNKVIFTGEDHTSTIYYSNDLQVFDEIKPEGCVWSKKGPGIECTLQKKTYTFWPRLLKDKTKMHWLKVDFNKWQDEDELEETKDEEDDMDLSQMMAQMGGGMPGGMPDMGDLGMQEEEEEEEDSDDEDIPDLEETPDEENKNA